jgi:hypothetical protein
VIGSAEAVTARTAWSLATTGAAYSAFEDRTRGRIAPGYLADFVVLAADPFELGDLGPEAVDATVAGGRPVFAAGGLAGWPAAASPAVGMAAAAARGFSAAAG